MSTYDEVVNLVTTARQGDKTEQLMALSNLSLLGGPLDKQSQDFLQSVFVSEGADEEGSLLLIRCTAIALAKYGDLANLAVDEPIRSRLMMFIEEVARNPKSTSDVADIGDVLVGEAINGLSRFAQHNEDLTMQLMRIIDTPDQYSMRQDSFSEMQKQIYQWLIDDCLVAIGALNHSDGAAFLSQWRDMGSLAAAVALEHFGEPYDTIRNARIDREKQKESEPEQVASAKSGGCFVATAVYGEIDHPDVQLLRAFRDQILMSSSMGRAFTRLYYSLSPTLVACIRGNVIKSFIKVSIIVPTLWLAKNQLQSSRSQTYEENQDTVTKR